jgi:hypothetical protein
MRTFRTVLEQKIWERRQTLEEFVEFAEMFAREHKEPGTLGVRHLQRLASGQGPKGRPLGPVKPSTARLLEHILGLSVDELLRSPAQVVTSGSEEANSAVPVAVAVSARLRASLDWLDDHVGWVSDTSRQRVASQVGKADPGDILDRHLRRASVGRSDLARAVADYYGGRPGCGLYSASTDGNRIRTTILTRPDWLDLCCPLTPSGDRMAFAHIGRDRAAEPDKTGASSAVDRLAEAAVLDVRVSNVPLYRLLDIDVSSGMISGTVDIVPFAEYALTLDLLEGELVDSVIGRAVTGLPLRDRYLPDLATVLDFRRRLCAGGVLGLCAIARPADPYRGPADYALLVQERSAHVLNSARRLAVIPKGFHQPLKDVRADARIGATLRREMEEELFGRCDVDSTAGNSRLAAPMHPDRLSEPMRWLSDDPSRMRLECTGFGVNLVSGNYEFASLIVIEDDEFWPRFGGEVEANWEASGLRLYSSLDRELISELITDETWSNEGLFAFLQGLRRLREVGGTRVDLPAVELDGS